MQNLQSVLLLAIRSVGACVHQRLDGPHVSAAGRNLSKATEGAKAAPPRSFFLFLFFKAYSRVKSIEEYQKIFENVTKRIKLAGCNRSSVENRMKLCSILKMCSCVCKSIFFRTKTRCLDVFHNMFDAESACTLFKKTGTRRDLKRAYQERYANREPKQTTRSGIRAVSFKLLAAAQSSP